MSLSEETRKVVLLGESSVGKTSIVLRFTSNSFDEKHTSTLQAGFFEKKLTVDGRRIKLSIWDTAGQEKFHALGPIYYRDSHAAILVYDITDKDSFERVKNWVRELRRILGNNVLLFLVGNKTDLEKERRIPIQDAIVYAESVGASHLQTSARFNQGIDQLFLEVTKGLLIKLDENASRANGKRFSQTGPNVIIVEESASSTHSNKCCG